MEPCRVIAIANQKGGVGKTVTTVSLGVGLARAGRHVLLVDADPQASLTVSLGIRNPDELDITISTVMQSVIEETRLYRHKESGTFQSLTDSGILAIGVCSATEHAV